MFNNYDTLYLSMIDKIFKIFKINIIPNFHIQKVKIPQLKFIQTIKSHNNVITSVSIFPSGKIISVSYDKSIKIFNENFTLFQIIKNAHNGKIFYVKTKDDNNFVTCSNDKNIKTWIKKENKFEFNKIIKKAHKDDINKVIYSLNNNIISCSDDKTIKIWEENKKENKYQLKTIIKHLYCIFSILLLEDKNILISSGLEGTKFWNFNNLELIFYIKETYCGSWNSLSRFDDDKIIVPKKNPNSIEIISLLQKKIVKNINFKYECFGIKVIRDKGIFLLGGNNKIINVYNINNYQCIQEINLHKNNISGFSVLKNGLVLSYSNDNTFIIFSIINI